MKKFIVGLSLMLAVNAHAVMEKPEIRIYFEDTIIVVGETGKIDACYAKVVVHHEGKEEVHSKIVSPTPCRDNLTAFMMQKDRKDDNIYLNGVKQ